MRRRRRGGRGRRTRRGWSGGAQVATAARSTRTGAVWVIGCQSSRQPSNSAWTSAGSSPCCRPRRPQRPCLRPLNRVREVSLGPLLSFELRRFASICARVAIVGAFRSRVGAPRTSRRTLSRDIIVRSGRIVLRIGGRPDLAASGEGRAGAVPSSGRRWSAPVGWGPPPVRDHRRRWAEPTQRGPSGSPRVGSAHHPRPGGRGRLADPGPASEAIPPW